MNDNRPVWAVDKEFVCVRDSQRLITKHDLWFTDADISQDVLQLTIVRRGISNGQIVNASTGQQVSFFHSSSLFRDATLKFQAQSKFTNF